MKKLFLGMAALVAMVATSCVQTEELAVANNKEAIGFDTFVENVTKAIYDNNNPLDHFDVYGTISKKNADDTKTYVTTIFDKVEVLKSGDTWSYDPNCTQYWIPGFIYDFAAVVDATNVVCENGLPATISTNMIAQNDVLYATKNCDFVNGGQTDKVSFQLAHLLSKAKFTVKNGIVNGQNFVYNIESVKITNAYETAEYNVADKKWTGAGNREADFNVNTAIAQGANTVSKDILLVPGTKELEIEIAYKLTYNNALLKEEAKKLTAVLTLEQGKAYNFVVELGNPGEDIKFEAVVDGWDEGKYDVNGTSVVATVEEFTKAFASEGINNIVLADDIVLDGTTRSTVYSLIVASGRTLTLDLNGHTLSGNWHKDNGAIIKNEGTLTVVNGTISSLANNGGSAIANYGTLTVEDATLNGAPREGSSWPSYPVNNYGDMTLTNTTIVGYHGCVALNAAGTTVINNCELTKNNLNTSSHIFYVDHADAKVVVNGGTYNHNGFDGSLAYVIKGEVTINGGTFNAKDGGYGFAALSAGKVTINGGNINAGLLNWGGQFVINGGIFSSQPKEDYLAEGYKAVLSNGKYVVVSNDVEAVASTQAELESALTTGSNVVLTAGEYTFPASSKFTAETVIACEEGVVFEGNSKLDINGATIIGATFSNPGGTAVDQTINGTFKGCTFEGTNGARWCYAGDTVVFEDCVFSGSTYGVHFDGGANDVLFKNCVLSGFNALGGEITLTTFENCTFVGNGKSGYNGANLWGSTKLINCEFTFDGSTATEWIHGRGDNKTYEFENCTVNGVALTLDNYDSFDQIGAYGNASTVKVNGEKIKSLTDLITYVDDKTGTITISSVRDLMLLEQLDAQWLALFSNGQGKDITNFFEAAGGKGAGYYYDWTWTVKLDADIDFKGATLNKPISLDRWGLLDGQGHTIKNVKVVTATDAENHAALFFAGQGVSMKSVKLDNVHVTGSFVGNSNAAIFASYCCEGVEDITITNSSVTGGKYTGAVVSSGYCKIKNCKVTNCVVKGGYKLGGIIGYICATNGNAFVDNNTLTGCTVDGADGQYAGGKSEYIVGKIVGNYNCNGTCKGNTVTNMTTSATANIGKIEAGFTVVE